jgi:hypothetical protein
MTLNKHDSFAFFFFFFFFFGYQHNLSLILKIHIIKGYLKMTVIFFFNILYFFHTKEELSHFNYFSSKLMVDLDGGGKTNTDFF